LQWTVSEKGFPRIRLSTFFSLTEEFANGKLKPFRLILGDLLERWSSRYE
jgi:hypothetical protein